MANCTDRLPHRSAKCSINCGRKSSKAVNLKAIESVCGRHLGQIDIIVSLGGLQFRKASCLELSVFEWCWKIQDTKVIVFYGPVTENWKVVLT